MFATTVNWLRCVVFVSTGLMCVTGLVADDRPDYLKQVKSVLRERCFSCHGALKQESGLRLDTAALMIQGGDSGAAIMRGDPDGSLLLERVAATDEDARMPPAGEGEPLTAKQILQLRTWIAAGAPAPVGERPQTDPRDHWAFQPFIRPAVPVVSNVAWSRNPIDAFIASQHEQHQLTPQRKADKQIWLRRVSLDLVGLPPTPEELAAFLADESGEAYENVVTRLLESPQYGQRWGRHWMDIWRYSDWWGLGSEVRRSQKHIWHWRDWIIESVNEDRGYDQMLREMLAADELYPNDLDRLPATGFLARQYFMFNRTSWLDETIEHTAKAMLGLTFNCAKCHDHKYDPFSQQEYYQLRAIFEPYQLRTEMVPGEQDFQKDGIPRAFDAHLDAETYLLLRGDDRNPDTSRLIEPAVPAFLTSEDLRFEIKPVELPPEASHPGLRPFVVEAHREAARQSIAKARTRLQTARKRLAKIEMKSEQPASASDSTAADKVDSATTRNTMTDPESIVLRDDFSAEQPEVWEPLTGTWRYENGRLRQEQIGASRTAIRLKQPPPTNFEARIKFVVVGGQTWKSVGISWDVTADGNELLAYVSASDSSPKSQIAYRRDGQYIYPQYAHQSHQVAINKPHEILLRVQGELVNLLVDGIDELAWRLPKSVPRKSGSLELMTFDASAEFLEFELQALSADDVLTEPGTSKSTRRRPVASARLAVTISEKSLAAAELQLASIEARAAADRASHRLTQSQDTDTLVAAASQAERALVVARADEKLCRMQLAVIKAADDRKADAERQFEAAKTALAQAHKELEKPADTYTPLQGALKSKEHYQDKNEPQPFPATSTGRRKAFAEWLTNPKHPLPARVAVNHIWARHFGQPLVPSMFDFGLKGKPPTHPALLDWLAAEFVEHNWSMKHIHRLITTSQAYRLSSSSAGANVPALDADPDNHFYWRMNPVRMEAQIVRDSLLHLAGELDASLGGPPIPVKKNSQRRSLYFMHSHNDHHKFLSMFDDANVLQCYRRSESIVPQQALALENSALVAAMAEKITQRILNGIPSGTDIEFIRAAFLRVLSMEPTPQEQAFMESMFSRLVAAARAEGRPHPKAHARVAVVQALINHNDFVTIR